MTALRLLQYSQHWQAAELFRVVPLAGPAALMEGARRAVLLVFGLPLFAVLAVTAWLLGAGPRELLLIPGLVTLPVYSLIPLKFNSAAPLSVSARTFTGTSGCLTITGMLVAMLTSGLLIAGLAVLALRNGWLGYFLAVEILLALAVHWTLQRSIARAPLAARHMSAAIAAQRSIRGNCARPCGPS